MIIGVCQNIKMFRQLGKEHWGGGTCNKVKLIDYQKIQYIENK